MAKKSARQSKKVRKDTSPLKPKRDPRIALGKNASSEHRCIPLEAEGFVAVVFVCSAKTLYQCVSINRRQEDKDEGYQRALGIPRVKAIAEFVNKGGIFPTGVVVAFERATLLENRTRIKIEAHPNAGWVIDGQHRLAGAHEAEKDTMVPVVAFLNLDIESQIKFFVTINQEQIGVPTSLYYDLLPYLDGEGAKEQQQRAIDLSARDLARALSNDETSHFFGRIVQTRPPQRGRELSLTNFIRKLRPHLQQPRGALAGYSHDDRSQVISNYYRALSMVFAEEFGKEKSFFFQTLGFGSLMDALPFFMTRAIERGASLQTKEFAALFSKIADFNFRQFEGMGTGAGSEALVARKFTEELQETLKASKDMQKSRIRISD